MAISDSDNRAGLRGIALLVIVGLAGAGMAAFVADRTRDKISDNRDAQVMKVLEPLLPAGRYDNEPHKDTISVIDEELLGSARAQIIYRARRNGEPVAAIIQTTAPNGYVAPIPLLVSVSPDGTVLGVRAVGHRETPGLGDKIDLARGDWILGFDGRSLGVPDASEWAVARDKGQFDQISGATITSRAVVHAVRDALLYFEKNREKILAAGEAGNEAD